MKLNKTDTLAGISAAGVCCGLAMDEDLNLEELDRELLSSAGAAFREALMILYEGKQPTTTKPCPPPTNAATKP